MDNGKCEPAAPLLPSQEPMEHSTSRLGRGDNLRSHAETNSEVILSQSHESQVPVEAVDSPEIIAFSSSLQMLPGRLACLGLMPRVRPPAPDELTAYVGDVGVERRPVLRGGSSVWVPRSRARDPETRISVAGYKTALSGTWPQEAPG